MAHRGSVVVGLVASACFAAAARAQFQSATVSVLAQASSHLDTTFGVNDRFESNDAGAYPLFQNSANADQSMGPSSALSRAQMGLELAESGLSATGSFYVSISAAEGFNSASVSALSRVWVDFSLATARTWKIEPGTTTGPSGNTSVVLSKGATQIFNYTGEFGGATGELAPGEYRLAITASAEIESFGVSGETGGTYSVGFSLGTVNPCPADFNGDHVVDDMDFLLFLPAYDTLDCADPTMPAGCPADLNGDGVVDDADFVLFLPAYNTLLCPE